LQLIYVTPLKLNIYNFRFLLGNGLMKTTSYQNQSKSTRILNVYQQQRSVNLRNQLVLLNSGLVRQIAYRLSYQCNEPYEDLEQIGYIGLIRAIERFDPQQGCAFSSFAVPYIRGEILHFLRDKGSVLRIPRRWQELQKKGQKVRSELFVTLGRQPKDEEIAQALEVSPEEWYESKAATQNRLPLSLDAKVSQALDAGVSLGDTLPDLHTQGLQDLAEDWQQLEAALTQLEDKTKVAIEFVFLKELPRKEAAKLIGISPMTVTRRLQTGIDKLSILLQKQTPCTPVKVAG
jgi:RNA polymerase sigma-B factor